MADYTEETCPECGQRLRIPRDIGGLLMVCPSCGKNFASDFKIGPAKRKTYQKWLMHLFEMPERVLRRLARFFTP